MSLDPFEKKAQRMINVVLAIYIVGAMASVGITGFVCWVVYKLLQFNGVI